MADEIKTIQFKNANVGAYLYVPRPGISYRDTCVTVVHKDGNSIVLLHLDKPDDREVIDSKIFDERGYVAVTATEVSAYFKDRDRE